MKKEEVYKMSEKERVESICEKYADIMTLSSVNGVEYKLEAENIKGKSEIVLKQVDDNGEDMEIMRKNITWKTEMEVVATISNMLKEIQEEQGNW